MAEQKKRYPNPKFRSVEEEDEYWKSHSPIAEGYEGTVQAPRKTRSSFLAVRLTGEELTRLRDIAAEQGLGPSTFARLLITSVIEGQRVLPKRVTLDELKTRLEQNLPSGVREKAEAISRDTAIGDPDSPALLVIDRSNAEEVERFSWSLLSAVLAMAGVQVITPEDSRYKRLRSTAA